jgi:hypothetical protein
MKKLIIANVIALIGFLTLISMLSSCTQEETSIIEQPRKLDVIIEGNSPEFWYHNATDNTTTYITQSHISMDVHRGDVITAIGYGYTIDNSNNYGASNVVVVGQITFKVNDVIVASGINNLSFQIK